MSTTAPKVIKRRAIKEEKEQSKTFIIHQGKVHSKNVLKDFQAAAGLYDVTHMVVFSVTTLATYMRTCRLPRGPTLTFRIHSYSLIKDVVNLAKKPRLPPTSYPYPPVVVMTGFGSSSENHVKLAAALFQNMFPTISVANAILSHCQRVVLVAYDKETDRIELRHYKIYLVTQWDKDESKQIHRVLSYNIPLSKYEDIANFILEQVDEKRGIKEENPVDSTLNLPYRHRTFKENTKVAVRLDEVGPRMQLELVKVESDFFSGDAIYHKHVHKTPEELAEIQARKRERQELKASRRREQEQNVQRKKKEKELEKAKSKKNNQKSQGDDLDNLPAIDADNSTDEDEDDAITQHSDRRPPRDPESFSEGPTKRKEGRTDSKVEAGKVTTEFTQPQIRFKKRAIANKQKKAPKQKGNKRPFKGKNVKENGKRRKI